MNRYDDRLDLRTNLVEAYEQLMDFVAKHLPDPFYLEGTVRVSLRDKIFREVVANLLVHREYLNGRPARFIIYADRVEVDNANHPVGHGPLDPRGFQPFPKNPTLAKFFLQLGRVEELGSGVRNVTRYLQAYRPGGHAEFIEEDVFRTVVPVPVSGAGQRRASSEAALAEARQRLLPLAVAAGVAERLRLEVEQLAASGPSTTAALARQMGVTDRTVRRDFELLRQAGIIETATAAAHYQLAG